MPQLEDITDLSTDTVELLEAVGYLDARELSEADPKELVAELVKANKALQIMPDNPTEEIVRQWQDTVGDHGHVTPADDKADVGVGADAEDESSSEDEEPNVKGADHSDTLEEDVVSEDDAGEEEPHPIDVAPNIVNFEEDSEVQEMLSLSPEAVSLEPSLIRRHKLAVTDIPEGILLTHCEGEVEMNVMTSARLVEAQRREAEVKRTGLMASRIRNFEEADSTEHHVKPLDKGKAKDAVSVSDGLNAGLRPESRRFVRGVLHPDPVRVRVSAFFAVLVEVMLIVSIIGIPWLLIHEHLSGNRMLWWVVGIGGGLLLSALCYLFWGLGARCRVCGQRQFAPKKCIKNKKAHHIPVVGYIFPTAMHAMFFKWFYCTYCGTAVRLKK